MPDRVFEPEDQEALAVDPHVRPYVGITKEQLAGLLWAVSEYAIRTIPCVRYDASFTQVETAAADAELLAANREFLGWYSRSNGWGAGISLAQPAAITSAEERIFDTREQYGIAHMKYTAGFENITRSELVALLTALGRYAALAPRTSLSHSLAPWQGSSGVMRRLYAHHALIRFRERPFSHEEFVKSMRKVLRTDHVGAALSEALADRYVIERELGRGGATVVYLAGDRRLGRAVALKVLPDSSRRVDTERFFREIRVTARLQHPHIQALQDHGVAGDMLFYAMPYVEGETLRHRLTRDGVIPVDEAFRLASEVAGALAYAHGMGIVHRDIKPENILLSRGRAIVADFGIAKAIRDAGNDLMERLGIPSRTGYCLAVGTAYQSPEQLSGADLDGRSDVFSLGCVLYEMLTAHLPFAGKKGMALRWRENPPVPSDVRPGMPAIADAIIAKCLAPNPAKRFASASELAAALADPAAWRCRSASTQRDSLLAKLWNRGLGERLRGREPRP